MRSAILYLSVFLIAGCNNSDSNTKADQKDSSGVVLKEKDNDGKGAASAGCSSYYWFKEGTVAAYSIKDPEGKELYHSTSTVTNVRNEAGALLADFSASTGQGGTVTATYKCEGDKIYMDMKSLFANNFKGLAEKGGMEMEVESAYLSFPSTMKVGDELEGTTFKITAKKDGKPVMTTTNQIKDRKVEAMEKITTAAGTWDCLKISETSITTSEMMGKQLPGKETRTVYWFAPGVGVIRNDNYSADNKLTMQTELVSLTEKP